MASPKHKGLGLMSTSTWWFLVEQHIEPNRKGEGDREKAGERGRGRERSRERSLREKERDRETEVHILYIQTPERPPPRLLC